MQPTDLRTHNIATILGHLSWSDELLSRAAIAAKTKLTKPTVSKLVDELITGGLVTEGAPVSQGRSGRPITPIRVAQGTLAGVGISVSADHVAIRVRDLSGDTIFQATDPGITQSPSDASTRACKVLRPALAALSPKCRIAGITVTIPGRIDTASRHIISAPNLNWENIAFADRLDSAFSAFGDDLPPVRLVNDARIITQTELLTRRNESFLLVYGETGIGGSIVIDGNIHTGAHGWAGEIGHTVVDAGGPTCRCGKRGCLESYASAWAMRRRENLEAELPISEIVALLSDDALADIGRWLGVAVANIVTTLDIPTIVFAGYFDQLFEHVHDAVRESIAEHILDFDHRELTLTRLAVQQDANLVGASVDALNPVFANPTLWI